MSTWRRLPIAARTWPILSRASCSRIHEHQGCGSAGGRAGRMSFEVLVLLIAIALAFDFLNGFHDAANSIATVVSTRVLRPHWAVAWASFFNFIAFLVFGAAVAATIGKGIIDAKVVDHYVVFGALIGAITWNVITWYY